MYGWWEYPRSRPSVSPLLGLRMNFPQKKETGQLEGMHWISNMGRSMLPGLTVAFLN
jgi:hypothetical protein